MSRSAFSHKVKPGEGWPDVNLFRLARDNGINYLTLRYRFKRGWTFEDAINTPPQPQFSVKNNKKRCTRCKKWMPLKNFTKLKRRTGKEYAPACRECDKKRCKKDRDQIRTEVISYYSKGSMACAICDEKRIEVLDLDHINGGGVKDRKKFKTLQALYRHVLKTKKPGFRILCRNCNWIEHLKLKKWGKYSPLNFIGTQLEIFDGEV